VARLPGGRRLPGGLAAAARESRIDAIADAVEEHLDLDAVLRLVERGAPPGLDPVRGGLVR
jgi:adenosylcobyric acid synthase